MQIKTNYGLKRYNTFNVDVKTNFFAEVKKESELEEIDLNLYSKFCFLGTGSNVLFVNDYEGIIIHSKLKKIEILKQEDASVYIEVGSGVVWDEFVEYCVNKKYYGIENLSLIPSSVGAAVVQNIGAYGVEVNSVVDQVKVYDFESKSFKILSNEACEFYYRESLFKNEKYNKYYVVSVRFKLKTKKEPVALSKKVNLFFKLLDSLEVNILKRKVSIDYAFLNKGLHDLGILSLKNVRKLIINKRNSKIPSVEEVPNAGSFFKSPIVSAEKKEELVKIYKDKIKLYPFGNQFKISVNWLLFEAGWVGVKINDVGFNGQSSIICNYSTDKSFDSKHIYEFSEKVIESIEEKFNITLEREVVIIK